MERRGDIVTGGAGRAGRWVVAVVVATLVITVGGSLPRATTASAYALSEAERRARSAELMPEPAATEVIASQEVPAPAAVEPEPMPDHQPAAVRWPEPATATIDVTAAPEIPSRLASPAAVPVSVSPVAADGDREASGRVQVRVADRAAATAAGVDGLLLELEPVDGALEGPVQVSVDYSGFADAYGGDWASRLHLVSLPDCASTSPETTACQEQTLLASSNDVQEQTVTAVVESETLGMMALSGGAYGPAGDWGATSLSPSATWQVSAQTGDFAWSYPMRVPPAPGGPAPALALLYSAGSLDGRSAGANNQTSWIGDGWDLTTGYVERKYVPCSQDTEGGNNADHPTEDLCWSTDNATLVFDGRAMELVRDATTELWHVVDDDATRVEQLTGGWNTDNDTEYWRITTVDGAEYYFGRGRRAAGGLDLGSAWTVPVFGNHSGEPCYETNFAASSCNQGWRWNLDYAVDTSGNTLTYFYTPETNYYGRNENTAVSTYVRGGYLNRIEYGQRAGFEESGDAPARVDFTVAERCLGEDCDPEDLDAESASSWPDVPFDQICTSSTSCPSQLSPTFFSRKRLTTITTSVLVDEAYQPVDTWTLDHTYPDPGDGTSPALWLETIGHQGLVGDPVTLPDVGFHGVRMANRVDTAAGPPMNRYRINAIDTESGATVSVNYTGVDCLPEDKPTPDTNTRRCFPVMWTPEGETEPSTEYFHKYLATSVIADPRDGTSQAVETHYSYLGDPAWHYNDNPLVPEAERTWGQFRGYATVDVTTGAPFAAQRSTVRFRYFRGMDGDELSVGGPRVVTVDGIADVERLNGFLREQITYNGPAGAPEVSATLSTPWVSPPTATGADGTEATLLGVGASQTRVAASTAPGGYVTTATTTTFDDTYGLPTLVDDAGDITTTTDDRCTRIEYVRNTTEHLVATVKRTETVAVACATTPARPDDVISDARVSYDGGAYGAAPTRGLVTATARVSEYVGGNPVYVTESTTTYDGQGRALTVTDALGRTATTAYTPATGGPVTAVTTTSPDPDDAGPATALVTTTEVNPAWGAPVEVTDPNDNVTTAAYDGLGRLVGVWLPGRTQGVDSANMTYAYTVSVTGPNAVTTSTLTAAEGYATSVALLDGLLRPRQSQWPSGDRDTPGRVVSDTVYDTRGLVEYANGAWFTTGDPGTALVAPTVVVPSRTRYVYDGAGRTVDEVFEAAGVEAWRTTTVYDGDRVGVQPPDGATPQLSISDARGRLVELRQYTQGTLAGDYQATTYAYDHAGNLAQVTDPVGNEWSYEHDLRGRQVGSSDPDRGTTTTVFDDAGQVVSTTDARGLALVYLRDGLGRVTELRQGSEIGTLRASWVFDTLAKGQLTSSTRYDGGEYTVAVTGYDEGDRPLGQSVTLPAGEQELAGTWTTSYAYAANGQLASTTLPAAGGLAQETVTTYYDELSTPEWTGGGDGFGAYVAGSRYSVFGQPLVYDLGTSAASLLSYSYEAGTRRLDRTWLVREGVTGYGLDLAYTYDDAGNPTSVVDTPTAPGGQGDAQCFAYDGLRRLTSAWTPGDADCAAAPSVAGLGGAAPYWTDYTFDAVGNRTGTVSHASEGNTTATYTYPDPATAGPHQLSQVVTTGPGGATTDTYAYDPAGNTITRALDGEPAQTLTWDVEGELTGVIEDSQVVGEYLYTADGDRLVRRQDDVTTVYLPGGQELALDPVGEVTATRYYTFNGQTIATRSDDGTVTTLVADPHATANLAIDNTTGAITHRYTDPYGNPRGATPAWPGDHGYLDRPTDSTGLVQLGARYYDPGLGRFASVDPVMDLTDPQQWNGYSYANNNPNTYTDPTGLAPGDYGHEHYWNVYGPGAHITLTGAAQTYASTYRPQAVPAPIRPPVTTRHRIPAAIRPPQLPIPAAIRPDESGDAVTTIWEAPAMAWVDDAPQVRDWVQSAHQLPPIDDSEVPWSDVWRGIRQVLSWLHPVTWIMYGAAEASGADCRYNSQEWNYVCGGAPEWMHGGEGSQFLGVHIRSGDVEEFLDDTRLLAHEARHQDQWLLVPAFPLVYLGSAGAQWLATGDTRCNWLEESAGFEDGGYDSCV